MAKRTEKRAHRRYVCRIPVQITADNRELSGFAVNMSLGGMLIETSGPLTFGTKLTLRFRLPALDSDTEVDATVRWKNESAVGLQFGSMHAKDVWAMNRLFKNIKSS